MPSAVTTNVTELPESRVRVEAQVAPEEVERRVEVAARALGRELRIPGFRKGKVPAPVVIKRVGREAVLDEAVRESLPRWYVDAIDAAGIVPVGDPDLNVGDLPGQGEPLTFTVEIGVRPTATLGGYRGLEVGRREPEVDEAEVDAEVERLRERLAKLETVERPAASGDFLVASFKGEIDGEAFAGGEARDQLIELGAGQLIPGFEDGLEGASAGEERTLEVTFPDDYQAEHLAGKPATFHVEVHEVKEKRLPDLDDDLAVDAGGFDSLEELREDIRGKQREQLEHAIEHEFEEAVVDAVVERAEIEVPDSLVHAKAHELVEESIRSLERRGIQRQMYLQITGKSEHELAHEAEDQARTALAREAVLAAVVEAEGIEPTEEELLEALAPAAEQERTPAPKLLKRIRERGSEDALKADVATRKAVELLVQEAKPVAKAPEPEPEAGSEPEAAEAAAGSGEEPAPELWTPGDP